MHNDVKFNDQSIILFQVTAKKLVEINSRKDLCIVVLCPLNSIEKVTEIGFQWNVMLIWLEMLVEEFIILRVLLEHNGVSGEEIRKTVRRHRTINVHLVLVLTITHYTPLSQ